MIAGWIGIRLGLLWDWLLIWGCGVLWDFIPTGMGQTKERDDGVDDGIVGLWLPQEMAVLKKLG